MAAESAPASASTAGGTFPVKTSELSIDLEGTPTTLLLSFFEDRLLIVVTQVETFGTILQARLERTEDGAKSFNVSVLLGKRDEPTLTAFTRHLADVLSQQGYAKPLLVCIGIKSPDMAAMKALVGTIVENVLVLHST